MLRRLSLAVLIGGILLVVGLIGFAGRIELGPLAARLATGALGRQVGIASLHVTPGRWLRVDLTGLSIANPPGGSRPAMVELGRASAEVEAWSLLRGPPVIRNLELAEASLLLERGAGRIPNWHFGPAAAPGPKDRSGFPTLLAATIRHGEVVVRTSSGQALRIRIETGEAGTTGPDAPVRLRAAGAYNGTPVALEADLDPIAVLRDASRPYGTDLRLTAGADARLHFHGHMTHPLDVDGVHGSLALRAPTAGVLLALAGAEEIPLDAGLALDGTLDRQGDLWRLTKAHGTVAGEAFTAPLLQLTEGGRGAPDAVVVELGLSRLDLNRALSRGRRDTEGNTDLPLTISATPDPLLEAKVTIGELAYAGLRATDIHVAGAQMPGRITLAAVAISTSGARLSGSGQLDASPAGGHGTLWLVLEDGDLDTLRQAFRIHPLPLSGRLDGRVLVTAEAATLNAAARAAQVDAVMAMRQGRIAREVIEMASTDMRLLFRAARGTTPVSCLLGVLTMRAGIGTVAPLRVRSAEGSIAGNASFDLRRRQVDLIIGSQRSTTNFFALDIPVRISGSFDDPDIRPASWSAEGRARLAADMVAPLPAELRDFARRNPCYQPG